MSDWSHVKRKVKEGKAYRDYVNVPLGEDEDGDPVTAELAFGLIPENDFLTLLSRIDLQTIEEYRDEEMEEWEERLETLQSTDDLTDEEEEELHDLHETLNEKQMEMISALGKETFNAIQVAGKRSIKPDQEDINEALEHSSDEQKDRFGRVLKTRQSTKQALKQEMETVLDDNPYLIKFTIGQAAINESQNAVGNG